MNLDEDTFLSAYLDGVLDPEQRQRVESSLVSDPRLADHLRGLTAVRDLIAALPRPSPVMDVSALVLTRIQERPVLGPIRLFPGTAGRSPRVLLAALSTAALVLAAVSLALIAAQAFRGPRPGRPVDNIARGPRPDNPGERRRPLDETRPTAQPSPESLAANRTVRVIEPAAIGPDSSERLGDAELQKVRRILDSPSLRKVFVVADVSGGKATRHVGDLLDTTPRKYATYICITVDPNVPVDPKHPGGASVFAVVMDDQELDRFRESLRNKFPGNLEETDPNPESVTQLADSGQVGVFPGTPVADLIVPDGSVALRKDDEKPLIPVKPRRAPRRPFTEMPDPSTREIDADLAAALAGLNAEAAETAPSPNPRGRAEPNRSDPSSTRVATTPAASDTTRPAERPRRPASVVLVWVTRPSAGVPAPP
jgi:hypothetical protein